MKKPWMSLFGISLMAFLLVTDILSSQDFSGCRIHYGSDLEMYDLREDPLELTDVYSDPSYSEVREQLHRELEELRVYYKDQFKP